MHWFTADLHLGHDNIRRYCNRPFDSVELMDARIITNWNSVIQPEDDVWIVGDFAFGKADAWSNYLSRLMGRKHLILGNHDREKIWSGPMIGQQFQTLTHYHELKIEDEEMDCEQLIVLCHYAFQTWNKSHHGSWHLHGHSHGTLPSPDTMARMDVGVDTNDFKPYSYEDVKRVMTRKVFKPVDHHGAKE